MQTKKIDLPTYLCFSCKEPFILRWTSFRLGMLQSLCEHNTCSTLRSPFKWIKNLTKWWTAKKPAKGFLTNINPTLFIGIWQRKTTFTWTWHSATGITPDPFSVVNTLISHMLKDYKTESFAWAKACYVDHEITYELSTSKGNPYVKRLLNSLDILPFIASNIKLGLRKYCFDKFI